MAIEIRELLIRTFVTSEDNAKGLGAGKAKKKKEKERTQILLSDVSKLLQQAQER